MKNYDNIERDAAFLRANIETNEERIRLPDSLKEDSIADLVSGKKQKRNKKAIVRRFVGLAAAACLALGIFTALDYGVYAPKQLPVTEDKGLAYAQSYDDIVSIVKDYAKYKKAESIRYAADSFSLAGSFNGFSKSAEADFDVPEMAADGAVSYGTAAGGVLEESATMAAGAPEQNAAAAPAEPAADNAWTAETASVTANGRAADDGVDFAETNTRVEGIGEADRVKTDGKYLYVASFNSIIGLFKAETDGTLTLTGTIDCQYDVMKGRDPRYGSANLHEFYVSGDRLYAMVDHWTCDEDWRNNKTVSGVMVYDIADRAAPQFIREYWQDGAYLSSRVVGDSLLTISNYYLDEYAETYTAENVIPGTYDRADGEKCLVNATDIAVVNTAKPDSYVVVTKADLSDLERSPETSVLFGGGCEVYCTADTLYVYNTEYNWNTAVTDMVWRSAVSTPAGETKTTVLSFDITAPKPVFKAKGTVEGYLLNSWSLDAYNGYLRLAATKNEENVVYVLNEQMEQVGELKGIAPGEIIKSVRFMGNTAYVVTFVQTDPLFVIDLSDPTKPEIKGEVKLPGFSSYLHPAGDGLLIGIGSGGTEDGIDGSAKISLFDVSDPTAPREADHIIFENAWLTSEYKAFVTVKSDGSFLIPLEMYANYYEDDGDVYYSGFSNQTGAVRVAVKGGKLVELNRYLISEEEPYWCNCDRALYIGDTVYAISGMPYLASFDMDSGELLYKESFADYFEQLYREHSGADEIDWESETAPPVVYNGGDVVMTSPAYNPDEPQTAVDYTTPEPDTAPIDGDGASGAVPGTTATPETEAVSG
jgi:uncharacterized secreted protein with C-terminal beta-propeller domain